MNEESLLNGLIKIHTRFSFERYQATATSQFCTMWSVNDPPDEIVASAPLEAVCDLIDRDIDEEYAAELYEMTLQEAAASLCQFINQPEDET